MTDNPQVKATDRISVPLLDLKAQYGTIRDEVRVAIDRVLESQHFILGPEVEALEREVAAYSQCEFGIGVPSGTDALLVSLMTIGIGPGDEVITTPYTFFATAGVIDRLGATPVFVDIDSNTFNLDSGGIERAISSRTRAIIPVHLFGQMADMDPILEVARGYKLYVIEDAAQAIGSEYKGRRAGSIGHLGSFSLFPSKNLGGIGDGGMITTNYPDLADHIRLLRNHGFRPKYHNKIVGGNFRLNALQAAVLQVKLKYLDSWTEARQSNAAKYRHLFEEAGLVIPTESVRCPHDGYQVGDQAASCDTQVINSSGIILPTELCDRRHIYNQFVIQSASQDALFDFLRNRRIGSEIYYPVPLHVQECFAKLGHRDGEFPASECAASETLALPIYPELTDEMLASVVGTIADFHAERMAGLRVQTRLKTGAL